MNEKNLGRALQHRTGVVPKDTRAHQHGTGKTGEIGESVDEALINSRGAVRAGFRLAIASVIRAAPSSNDSKAGLTVTDIVDDVLGALLNFTELNTIVECILKVEGLTTDLHERMTRGI